MGQWYARIISFAACLSGVWGKSRPRVGHLKSFIIINKILNLKTISVAWKSWGHSLSDMWSVLFSQQKDYRSGLLAIDRTHHQLDERNISTPHVVGCPRWKKGFVPPPHFCKLTQEGIALYILMFLRQHLTVWSRDYLFILLPWPAECWVKDVSFHSWLQWWYHP